MAGAAKGHHVVPQAIWKNLKNLSPAARKALDSATTGSVPGGHNFKAPHPAYNKVVAQMWGDFTKGMDLSKMTAGQVESFVGSVRSSQNEAITWLLGGIEQKQLAAGIQPRMGLASKCFVGLGLALFVGDTVRNGFSNALDNLVNNMVDPFGLVQSELGRKPTEWDKKPTSEMW